jgi:hypothetical protein
LIINIPFLFNQFDPSKIKPDIKNITSDLDNEFVFDLSLGKHLLDIFFVFLFIVEIQKDHDCNNKADREEV